MSVLKLLKGRSLFVIECIEAFKGEEPILTMCISALKEGKSIFLLGEVMQKQ